MTLEIFNSWKKLIIEESEKDYYEKLMVFLESQYQTEVCYPAKKNILKALELTPLEDVKIVILGQDPYHGIGQAHGLSFSVNDGVKFPPSLRNIFKELKLDTGLDIPFSGNLTHWAEQGVLLLNATLSVQAGKAGSHQNKGWESFTDAIIRKINDEKNDVVFMLWGTYAQKKCNFIDEEKHFVLKAKHPSPLSANFGGWFGEKHFSKSNEFLKSKGKEPIQWA